MKKIHLLLFCLFVLNPVAHAYSSLEELLADTDRRQIAALRAYVEANPGADDFREARERLIYGLINQDLYGEALALLEQMYLELPADKSDLPLDEAFGEVVVPLIQVYRMEGRKEDALAFIEKVRGEFSTHTMADVIEGALDEFAGMFDAPSVGDSMELVFTAMDGREVDLAAMRGQVVLVDFWATWCMPCILVMPELKALHQEFHEKGFEIIGISLDEEREKLETYIQDENLPWPQFFDGLGWDNEFAKKFGIQSIPTTYLIGPDGLVAAVDATVEQLRAQINEFLGDAD